MKHYYLLSDRKVNNTKFDDWWTTVQSKPMIGGLQDDDLFQSDQLECGIPEQVPACSIST